MAENGHFGQSLNIKFNSVINAATVFVVAFVFFYVFLNLLFDEVVSSFDCELNEIY